MNEIPKQNLPFVTFNDIKYLRFLMLAFIFLFYQNRFINECARKNFS